MPWKNKSVCWTELNRRRIAKKALSAIKWYLVLLRYRHSCSRCPSARAETNLKPALPSSGPFTLLLTALCTRSMQRQEKNGEKMGKRWRKMKKIICTYDKGTLPPRTIFSSRFLAKARGAGHAHTQNKNDGYEKLYYLWGGGDHSNQDSTMYTTTYIFHCFYYY